MRRILFLAVPLSLFATSIIIGLPGVGINPVSAQSVRPLPTQILTTETPADITIIQGQNAVVGHGDFNGDGVADFLVAYRRTMTAGGSPILLQFGIVFGKPHPTDRLTIDLTRRGPDVSLINPVKPPMGDSYIIKLDDLSGDGIDDFAVAEQPIQGGRAEAARFKVFFGARGLQPGTLDLSTAQPAVTVLSGMRVFSPPGPNVLVGDVNADGVPDLILQEGVMPITVHVLFGPFGGGRMIDLREGQSDVTIAANNRDEYVTNVQLFDFNGDGRQDILATKTVFRPLALNSFELTDVVFGSPDLKSGRRVELSDHQADAETMGARAIAFSDLNDDGVVDLIAGNASSIGDAYQPWVAGNVQVRFGVRSAGGITWTLPVPGLYITSSMPPEGFTPVPGAVLSDGLGASLTVADVNHDGIGDVLISAPGMTHDKKGYHPAGAAYVLLGSPELRPGYLRPNGFDLDITFRDDPQFSTLGTIRSGDFDGDGLADIFVAGADAYVYFGGPLRAPQVSAAKYKSTARELKVFGTDLNGAPRLEVNGVVLDQYVVFDAAEGALVLQGTPAELNLRDGRNEVAVLRKGARSNTVKIKVK